MTIYLGDFPAGETIYIPFHTFNSSGASVTITGLAVTDIEIYKDGSTTQRASDAGYTLLDTDGIDFDGLTGIHGFSVNTGDNTDAGFYVAGSDYWVVVSAITVDTQAVSFVAAIFSIENRSALRPTTAGRTLDVTAGGNAGIDLDNVALTNGAGAFGIQASGTLSGTHSATTADLGTNAPASTIAGMTLIIPTRTFARVITSYNTSTGVATFDTTAETLTNGDQYYVIATPTASSSLPVPANMIQLGSDTQSATDLKDFADAGYDPSTNKVQGVVLTDTVTTLTGHTPQTGDSFARIGATGSGLTSLATQASVNTIDDFLDTEIAAIKTVTDNLPNSGTLSSLATASAVAALQTTLNTSRYLKNTSSQRIYFVMVLSSDHVSAATGVTITAQRSLDGAAFGSATGAVTEIGNGLYFLSTSAADMNADDVVFRFTGSACDPVQIHIPTAS